MKTANRWILAAIILSALSTYLTAYTFEAHSIAAGHIFRWNGETWWRTSPSGSLFPWPKKPGMLEALSKVNDVDLFIYSYLIESWILVVLTVLMWGLVSICVYKAVKELQRNKTRQEDVQ
ncbi:hypothetical protein KEJ15_05045 [Candidatus Bathyarchaeota archaeon]|nr:hypothetical protein [Candidatus Bathyarchaeota archaeon]